jgi:ligand-binding sensor domain-containing protein
MSKTQQLLRLFIDKTGAVWVGTANGLLVLSVEKNNFRRYLHVDDAVSTASRYAIRAMTQVGNQLWVNTHTCQLVDLQTGHTQLAVSVKDVHPIYTLDLCPLAQTNDGALWTFSGGVLRYDPQTAKATSYRLNANNSSVSAWPDNRGKVWLGLQQGLLQFDTERKQPVPFTQYNQYTELAQQRISGFFPDRPAGKRAANPPSWLWLTTSSGLYQLDLVRGITARYSTKDNAPHRLPFDHLSFIHPDPEQAEVYWLATLGGGLVRWNRADGTYQQFTTKEGLSDNTLYAIYEDKHQRLWLPSNNGLMSFHRKTHQIQIYHTKDGIADEEFNLMAHYRAPDGRLFLGGLNGITAFYPDQIQDNQQVAAPLLVAQYQKLNTEIGQMVSQLAAYQQQHKIHLSASDRLFKVSFALLDYRYLGQTRLWYRIQNWQEKWLIHEGNELSINGLPPGEYSLEVRAQTINGDWASSIVSIPITVDKPVYLRGWFLLLCFLLLGGLVMAVFRWRNRQLVADKYRLEAEVARRTAQIEEDKAIIERQAINLRNSAQLKARFFANVTHEFKTPLTLLLGPLQYLSGRITDMSTRELVMTMDRNARQLLTLVNDFSIYPGSTPMS